MLKALKKKNSGKSPRLAGIPVDFLKQGGEIIVKKYKRIFNMSVNDGKVLED